MSDSFVGLTEEQQSWVTAASRSDHNGGYANSWQRGYLKSRPSQPWTFFDNGFDADRALIRRWIYKPQET